MLRESMDAFWSENLWLPANISWNDISNAPHKTVVYAEHKDLLYQIPFTLLLLILRYTLEKYGFTRLGKLLGVKDSKGKNAPHNPILEAAFRSSSHQNDTRALAKQLHMTERQVERWWRLRRGQDKPSLLVKFSENMWRATFYLSNLLYGLYVFWDKEWLWNLDDWHMGYPHQGISNDIWWYYTITTSFYWSATISQFRDVRRKDFWQMFVSNIVTIALLSFSWVCNLHRIGTVLLLLHDCADIFIEIGKAAKYAHFQRMVNYLFIVFVVVWIVTRIIIFPFIIIKCTFYWLVTSPAISALKTLIWLMFSLHLVWTWLIMQTAQKAYIKGQVIGDIRSSCSEISDDSQKSNHSPNRICKQKKYT